MITKQEIFDLILNDYATEFGVAVGDLGQSIQKQALLEASRDYQLMLRIENLKKKCMGRHS